MPEVKAQPKCSACGAVGKDKIATEYLSTSGPAALFTSGVLCFYCAACGHIYTVVSECHATGA